MATELNDGLPGWWGSDRQQILSSTMTVTCDGKRLDVTFDPASRTLTATGEGHSPGAGEHILSIHYANLY